MITPRHTALTLPKRVFGQTKSRNTATVVTAYAVGVVLVTLAQLTLDRLPDRIAQASPPAGPVSMLRNPVRIASPLNANRAIGAKADFEAEVESR
jgi:hypothetical protein